MEQNIECNDIKVLVVEDDLAFRFIIVEALLQAGCEVLEADNGKIGLEVMAQEKPDIVLMDVLMPEMDGYKATKAIRKLSDFNHLPILMMTGLDDDMAIDAAYRAGATDFITKPFNVKLLVQRVRYMVRSGGVMKELIKSQHCLSEAQNLAKLAYWEWDSQNNQLIISNSFSDILNVEEDEIDHSFKYLLDSTVNDDRENLKEWINAALVGKLQESITHRVITKDKQERYVYHQVKAVNNDDGKLTHLYGSMQNITKMRDAQDKIRKLAYYDSLTGLPNRNYFSEILSHALNVSDRYGRMGALLFIGLDTIKRINDTLGHHSGDIILTKISKRIAESLRRSDVMSFNENFEISKQLARFGGDEFILLLPELTRSEDAAHISKRIIEAINKPFDLESNEIIVKPNIGISIFPKDGKTADECIRNSGIAMHHAKVEGENNFRYFDKKMNIEAIEKMQMESSIRSAYANSEFELHYQPQIDISNGKFYGVEALIRWISPTSGFIPPDAFIPIAEENGTIVNIGSWVLKEACSQAKSWLDSGMPLERMAVNVSARQFSQSNFCDVVLDTLRDTGLPAHKLELEMTESLLMNHAEAAIEVLNKLKKIGLSLSIDDFGTGYSSLAYLKKFPIDHLKIDKSFIDDVEIDKNNAEIVKAVIAMANSMDLTVTAEGVENKEQLDFLQKQKCAEVQGYYFSKPLVPASIPEFVNEVAERFFNVGTPKELIK